MAYAEPSWLGRQTCTVTEAGGDSRLETHGRALPSIAGHFQSYFRLSSLHDAVAATRESFGDEHWDPSTGGVVRSVLRVSGLIRVN